MQLLSVSSKAYLSEVLLLWTCIGWDYRLRPLVFGHHVATTLRKVRKESPGAPNVENEAPNLETYNSPVQSPEADVRAKR
jgi:hypothetical protein